jgi:hypothetical protein
MLNFTGKLAVKRGFSGTYSKVQIGTMTHSVTPSFIIPEGSQLEMLSSSQNPPDGYFFGRVLIIGCNGENACSDVILIPKEFLITKVSVMLLNIKFAH